MSRLSPLRLWDGEWWPSVGARSPVRYPPPNADQGLRERRLLSGLADGWRMAAGAGSPEGGGAPPSEAAPHSG